MKLGDACRNASFMRSLKQAATIFYSLAERNRQTADYAHRGSCRLSGAANSPECDPGRKRRDPSALDLTDGSSGGKSNPPGKVLMPGMISHATNVVEHPELVCERIVRIAQLVGRENVIAGTDCGFAQGPFYRRVHPSIVWAKLEALAEGARLASRELWSRAAA